MIRDYIISVDTETSGIPKKWNAPYSDVESWPYNVQIAWIVYDKYGNEIKSENHYIRANDFQIEQGSIKIHGITEELLKAKGEERLDVFKILSKDLEQYKPLVISHFMEFDNHMIELGFRRAGLNNNSRELPKFCTMRATVKYTRSLLYPHLMKLDELYNLLFRKNLENYHNAYHDSKATGECFFEMLRRGDLTESEINEQITDNYKEKKKSISKINTKLIWFLGLAIVLIVILIIVGFIFNL